MEDAAYMFSFSYIGVSYIIHLLLRIELDRIASIETYGYSEPKGKIKKGILNFYGGFLYFLATIMIIPGMMWWINDYLEKKASRRYYVEERSKIARGD